MTKALVVLSGGQDSTTCLVWAKERLWGGGFDEVHAVTFDYGQRHAIEIESAIKVAKLCGVASHEVIKLPIGLLGDKTLMLNAMFLNIAANRASRLGIDHVVTGVGMNNPDCRDSFISSQERTIELALGQFRFQIHAPLIYKSKDEVIKMMWTWDKLSLLAFTHTACDGRYPPLSDDLSTVRRAQAFEEAGLPDPLILRAALEGLMPLPTTANYQKDAVNFGIMENIKALSAILENLGGANG